MTTNHSTLTITYPDGYSASARLFTSPNPRRAVLYIHGIQSHSGWYIDSAQHLQQNNCTVLMPDRRGSGLNQADRGHAQSAAQLIADLAQAADHLRQISACDQLDILAVSWGAKLALAYAAQHLAHVRSITLVGPGLCPKIDIRLTEKIAVGLQGLIAPRKLHPIPLTDPHLFTANPDRQTYIAQDPLMLREATASFFIASKRLDFLARAAVAQIHVPLHLFLAAQDRIINNQATLAYLQPILTSQQTYPNAHHTLEFEPDPVHFFNDLAAAILK
ncbi:MAG: alpha/beta fold hydrolase [Sedimentisphaerales bacterium]|nr:alpha/beta fold hydrolase [Sedimentisphaerales bacterium]